MGVGKEKVILFQDSLSQVEHGEPANLPFILGHQSSIAPMIRHSILHVHSKSIITLALTTNLRDLQQFIAVDRSIQVPLLPTLFLNTMIIVDLNAVYSEVLAAILVT